MKCPHCKKELSYPEYAWHNAIDYHKSANVATSCCGKAIRVSPSLSVNIEPIEKDWAGDEDDWGTPYK